MEIKKLIYITFVLFAAEMTFAVNCGETVSTHIILNQNLNCNGSGVELTTGNLNCNGFSIIGNGTGIGVLINGNNQKIIENCYIENFENGIVLSSKYTYIGNGWGGGSYVTLYPSQIQIRNNTIKSNQIGILTSESISESIYDNIFQNNSKYGIYLTSSNAKIWNNSFFKTGIFYTRTKENSFCNNNISNLYYDNAKGPKCDCILPYENLEINSYVLFCQGIYNFSSGIKITQGGNLDCNNSSLIGNGTETAINFLGVKNGFIKNCIISNYNKGIDLNIIQGFDGRSYFIKNPTLNNYFENLKIVDVNFGVLMQNDARVENIHSSIIISKNYNIYNLVSRQINATDNYWGTTNKSEIESKFLDKNKIYYTPYFNNTLLDLSIEKILFSYNENSNLYLILEFNNESHMITNLDFNIFILRDGNIINKLHYKNYSLLYHKIELNINESLNDGDLIYVILDPENKLLEKNEYNNFAKTSFKKELNHRLNINTNNLLLNEELKSYLEEYYFKKTNIKTLNLSKIEINISVIDSTKTFDENYIFNFNNKPFQGKIRTYNFNNTLFINIEGNDIEGVLAGVLFLSKNINLFGNNNFSYNINSTNLEAIAIYDYLHKNENLLYYKTQNIYFRNQIRDILYDKKYGFEEIEIFISTPENISKYRLWKFDSKNTEKYKNFVDKDKYPIIFAGGLWSNIKTWQTIGRELANEGYEVYLIELTGNENLECETCYNYDYDFLINKVYPMYINTILNLSNSSKVKYVGHSNGARVALDSIHTGKINKTNFDNLILVGVPGSFEGDTLLKETIFNMKPIIEKNSKNKTHILITDLLVFWKNDENSNKISSNLWKQYYFWMENTEDIQPGNNLSISKFTLISGNFTGYSDGIVTIKDEKYIFQNIFSSDKFYYETSNYHIGMSEKREIIEKIKMRLN